MTILESSNRSRGGRYRCTLLQIIAKQIIIDINSQIIDHEMHSPFAYLKSLVDDFSSVDNKCDSDQIRSGVPDKHKRELLKSSRFRKVGVHPLEKISFLAQL